MVIPRSWYATASEHVSDVQIGFNPYDTAPNPQYGGAVSITGIYDMLPPPTKSIQLAYELGHGIGYAPLFQPVPPSWWTDGQWRNRGVDPSQLQLNLDQFEPNNFLNTVTITMLSWDGTSQEVRSADLPIATTVVDMLNHLATVVGVPFSAGADLTVPPFSSVKAWPQLQGVLADALKQISGGLGINISYAPASKSIVGLVTGNKPRIRLINPEHLQRKIVRPQFVPEVKVACYNTFHGTNATVYSAPSIIQVVSGEDQDIVVPLSGTPISNTLSQPVAVAGIPVIPYPGPNSIYCVYDSDGYEAHGPFLAYGGNLTVAVGATPDELVIHVKAPFDASNPKAAYSIAEGDNPALYICAGDATVYNKQDSVFFSGAVSSLTQFRPADYTDPYLDNAVIASNDVMYSRAVAYLQQMAEPQLTLDEVSFDSAVLHDRTTGAESAVDPATMTSAVFKAHQTMWRFTQLKYDQPTNSWTGAAAASTTCADFDAEFGSTTLLTYQQYLAADNIDSLAPVFGKFPGQFPPGTPMDAGLAALVAPPLEQWALAPLRAEQA